MKDKVKWMEKGREVESTTKGESKEDELKLLRERDTEVEKDDKSMPSEPEKSDKSDKSYKPEQPPPLPKLAFKQRKPL